MESFILYLLKSAALLSIFYLTYSLLLRKDTSFNANRTFLTGGLIASIILPSIYFTRTVLVTPIINKIVPLTTNSTFVKDIISVWKIIGIIYLIIAGFFLLRFLFQLFKLTKLIRLSKVISENNFRLVSISEKQGPFSFFKYIFFNSNDHSKSELQLVLAHEKVHANQLHSIDILLANLITVLLWFNPLSWYYKKSIEQNLEYIADRETACQSESIQAYQNTLVNVCLSNQQIPLVNHFHQSFIKKRIVMLNNKSSHRSSSIKMLLVAPFIFIFMLSFNVKTQAQIQQDHKLSDSIAKHIEQDNGLKFVIKADFTKADLEKVQQEVKNTSDLSLSLKDIERNEEGLISNLSIKISGKNNHFASSNYSDKSGIPDVYFGHTEGGGMKVYSLTKE